MRAAVLVQCRVDRIEPPGRIDRIITSARARAEKAFCARTVERLGEVCASGLLALVAAGNEAGTALLADLKQDPGSVGLESLLAEITKLNSARMFALPEGLFADSSEKWLAAWRARAIKMYPSDFRDTAEDARATLLAALCSVRQAEITDALDTAIGKPDETVRRALYPVVGEKTLWDLVAEAKANEKVFKAKVRTTLRSSYSSYYRQMLPPLLKTLGFRSNNTAYRPMMDALALLEKYATVDGKTRFYDASDAVPMDGVVRKDWREAVMDERGRIERIPYELCVLVALRDAIRRREISIEGAARWRNPEDDLPGDFEAARTVHYAAIRRPMDPQEFITDLKKRITAGLDRLSMALADGSAGEEKVTTRHGDPWITVPKLVQLLEPTGLQALKDEVIRRWGVLDLLDGLKNADFLTRFTDELSSVAAYERIDRATLQRRLLLALFAPGTNKGIRAIVSTREHGESEAEVRVRVVRRVEAQARGRQGVAVAPAQLPAHVPVILVHPHPAQDLHLRQHTQPGRGVGGPQRGQQLLPIPAEGPAPTALVPLRLHQPQQPVRCVHRELLQCGSQALASLLQGAELADGGEHVGGVGALAAAGLE